MQFDDAHAVFIDRHLSSRSGERRGRLGRGHNFAERLFLEQVWWPLFGNFDHLHPEYEVYDWNRKSQFIDFAFLPAYGKFGIECDGYQSHIKDMDREKFSYSLNRDTFLTGMGWRMMHFSFDDIKQRPEICRMLLQLAVSPYVTRSTSKTSNLSLQEREVLRIAGMLEAPIRPKDVINHCNVNYRTARKWLQALADKQLLQPQKLNKYTCSYELYEGWSEHLL